LKLIAVSALLVASGVACAQWDIQHSGTEAGLRGISSAGPGVAWASGTDGTLLRTEDGGYLWQRCKVPPGAEKLDFRGVQGWDANNAVVMSSGKGELSRIYRTTDGCASWTLVMTNPDADGFWDAIAAIDTKHWIVLGDPVNGKFVVRETLDGGATWKDGKIEPSLEKEGAFAASNSSISLNKGGGAAVFGTGSPAGARMFARHGESWVAQSVATLAKGESAGIFSIYATGVNLVAVGGDYRKPDVVEGTAVWSSDGGKTWHAAQSLPRGFRSAVAYDSATKSWIAVGPNGTDISRDEGRNWQPLKPGQGEATDADREWNALSLPFAVGPKGRIGRLRDVSRH
jgi:photosystem II stability/assembly factor-like uncharacterized protein